MKITKSQLQKIKMSADNLLKKMDDADKQEYRKIVKDELKSFLGVFDDKVKMLDKVDKEFDKAGVARELNKFLGDFSKKIDKINDFQKEVSSLSGAIGKLSSVKPSEVNFDKVINSIEKLGFKLDKEDKSEDRTDELIEAIKGIEIGKTEIEFPEHINVGNFPPQLTPQPVTNININPLRGFIHTTAQTLTSSLATIPAYGVLDNRRSVQFYNNSSTVTVYMGGSDVTSSTGIPVPPKSYSPVIDAGIRMVLYGVTSSSTADIRVMETSMDAIGG